MDTIETIRMDTMLRFFIIDSSDHDLNGIHWNPVEMTPPHINSFLFEPMIC